MRFYSCLTMGCAEALGLRWCDIDLENGRMYLRQQIGRINGELKARELKTKNSCRILPVMDYVREALLEHARRQAIIPPQFDPYFELSAQGTVVVNKVGTPLEPRSLIRHFHTLTEKTGLPRIKIHAIRHTTATILKDLAVPVKDVQLILGHAKFLLHWIFTSTVRPKLSAPPYQPLEIGCLAYRLCPQLRSKT